MPIDPTAKRNVGRSTLKVPTLGLGTVFLADPDALHTEAEADAVMEAAWNAGVRYFDTAPWYGNTLAEHRLGRALWRRPRESFVLTTKIGRTYRRPKDAAGFDFPRWKGGLKFELRFDYGRDAVQRSYEDSLQRLGLNTVDALAIHDLDLRFHQTEEKVKHYLDQLDGGGGFRVLEDLKRAGEIKAIGAGINHTGMIPQFLERFAMDYFLVAMPYTLLDQQALDGELALCAARGVSVVIGAPFASGILATGAVRGARYRYVTAEPDIVDKVKRIEAVCARHAVPLAAAALQFPLFHPVVAATIPGADAPAQIEANVAHLQRAIPPAFWAELKGAGLLRADAPTGD
ncbi:MAG TPA: aldo/keto reductase [Burkholderiales bacterium]